MITAQREVEIKFRIDDIEAITGKLLACGFRPITPRTHELNTLYDRPGLSLRRRGALLRIRQYGSKWTVTFKDRKLTPDRASARHKSRREIETVVEDGGTLGQILEAVGFKPVFCYEKFRSEWTDGSGHVVLDETPLGAFGEIEGAPSWIDSAARRLGIGQKDYITATYAELFLQWKKKKRSPADNMLFSECR